MLAPTIVGIVVIVASVILCAWAIYMSKDDTPVDYYRNSDGEMVTAMRLSPELVTVVSVWANAVIVEEIDPETGTRYPALNVQCGDEVKRASLDDYVVKKDDGTFDVKKPNEFRRQHQPID